MYAIYWTIPAFEAQVHRTVPEADVKEFMDALDRLGFPVDKVEML